MCEGSASSGITQPTKRLGERINGIPVRSAVSKSNSQPDSFHSSLTACRLQFPGCPAPPPTRKKTLFSGRGFVEGWSGQWVSRNESKPTPIAPRLIGIFGALVSVVNV